MIKYGKFEIDYWALGIICLTILLVVDKITRVIPCK